jgi:hypothetical protein
MRIMNNKVLIAAACSLAFIQLLHRRLAQADDLRGKAVAEPLRPRRLDRYCRSPNEEKGCKSNVISLLHLRTLSLAP